jgi:hypothetical protein
VIEVEPLGSIDGDDCQNFDDLDNESECLPDHLQTNRLVILMGQAFTRLILKRIQEFNLEKTEDELDETRDDVSDIVEEVKPHMGFMKRKLTKKEKTFVKMLDQELLVKMKKGKGGFDKNLPIYEYSLSIFMPGDKIQFVERWCSVTPFCFQYHTRQKMRVDGRPPLNTIWLKDIEMVAKANVKTANGKKVLGQQTGHLYQFEITVKGDVEYDAFEEKDTKSNRNSGKI